MSRSGYTDDGENWERICWRGAVSAAIKGKRGQQFLREVVGALDAMPVHELIAGDLEHEGQVCTLGSVGQQRHLVMGDVDIEDRDAIAGLFGIAPALAAEIMYMNDEGRWQHRIETPHERWVRMRSWVSNLIREEKP